MIALYHQTKIPISFWCRQGLNPKSLIQPSEILLVELPGTHGNFVYLNYTIFNKCTQFYIFNIHNFSRKVNNYVYLMYTFFSKIVHNFVYLMYTIFRRMYTNFSNNVYNSIHSM